MSKLEEAGRDALAAVERSLAGYDRGLFLKIEGEVRSSTGGERKE